MLIRQSLRGVAFAAIFVAGPVWSQPQGDPLAQMCEAFLASSGASGQSNPSILCGCLVSEVQAQLSQSEMRAYQDSVSAGRPLPPVIEQKVTAIAVRCLTAAR